MFTFLRAHEDKQVVVEVTGSRKLKNGLVIPGTFNPFAPGDFAEKRVLKLIEWFSDHCRAIKS